jgi:hypothetical protein
MENGIFEALADFGGLIVLAGALLTGIVMTKASHENVMKQRDIADAQRDARLEDQKTANVELTSALNDTTEALRRLADAWEARNRLEAEQRKI